MRTEGRTLTASPISPVVVWLVAALALVGCGTSGSATAQYGTDQDPGSASSESADQEAEQAAPLGVTIDCDGLSEEAAYEPGMSDAPDAATQAEAIDRYWSDGDGAFFDDRSELTEQSGPDETVYYVDGSGRVQLILTLEQHEGGWSISMSERCF